MRKAWALLTVILLSAAACDSESTDPSGGSTEGDVTPVVHAASLERFDACPDLLRHLRAEGRKRVGPFGLPGSTSSGGMAVEDRAVAVAGDASAGVAGAAESAPTQQDPSGGFSGTNVQVAGVDEPDIIKTNGRHIFTVRQDPDDLNRQRLTAIAIEDGRPRLVGGVVLPQQTSYQLLLAGDRILALAHHGFAAIAERGVASDAIYPAREQKTEIVTVDISDPANLRIANKLQLDGSYASARLVDGIARIVLNAPTDLPFEAPTEYTPQAQRAALERNKQLINRADINEWLPRFEVQSAGGDVQARGPLSSCDTTYHPKSFSGFGTTTVVTLDPKSPDPRKSASVLGGAGTVYASPTNLYVATQRYPEVQPMAIEDEPVAVQPVVPDPAKTSLHRFDIADPARAVYEASGEVRGTVLNQWSLDEHDGHLRVATTEDRFDAKGTNASSSFVTTLTATGPQLKQVGQVGGLGKTERIYGVRFMGDVGYVVTFRQIDPLYVVDLSTPARPRVLGELKIPGYSAYLHPVDDSLLLGIGQDATEEGQPIGTQVSLFDVGNPAEPKQLDKVVYRNANTPVEHDHHAFTWWEPSKLAIVPVARYDERGGSSFAYGLRIDGGSITEAGRANHGPHSTAALGGNSAVQRSLVIGDSLFTLSPAGLLANDLGSFDEIGFVPFAPYGR